MIHRRLRRIADAAFDGGTTTVEDLDRVAEAVAGLHRRIVLMTEDPPSASLEDVVATRRSIDRSLALVREGADEVLAH